MTGHESWGGVMAPRIVSGEWVTAQSNGRRTFVALAQNGTVLSGTAQTFNGGDEDSSLELVGTVSDANLELDITWSGARGRYEGTFQPDGTLTGITSDIQHPESQATWFSDGRTFALSRRLRDLVFASI
jgi:hypothetical protein